MYCEGFVYDGEGKEKGKQDMVDNIVGLYVEFFQKNDCGRRAEEIRNMVQKNLCERVRHFFIDLEHDNSDDF